MGTARQFVPPQRWDRLVRTSFETAALPEGGTDTRRVDDFIAKAAVGVDGVRLAARAARERLGRLHAEAVIPVEHHGARPEQDNAEQAAGRSAVPEGARRLDIIR